MPLKAAGPRTEMARSLPMPIGERPAPIAAPSPPLEPPAVRSRFHGLLVRPVMRLSLSVQAPNSGLLAFIKGTPPAALKRATEDAALSGCTRRSADERHEWAPAAAPSRSLIEKGTPWS